MHCSRKEDIDTNKPLLRTIGAAREIPRIPGTVQGRTAYRSVSPVEPGIDSVIA